jgi:GntR family transcriptional regulator
MNQPRLDPRTDRRQATARRVRDLLRSAIVGGDIGVGALPSEAELMLAASCSRQVVRDALGMLRDEGYVTRSQGTGTFVVTSKVKHSFNHLHGVDASRWVTHELLSVCTQTAPPRVAERLQIGQGSDCGIVDYRVRLDGTPYYVATAYVPVPLVPVLQRAELVREWYSVYEDAGIVIGVNDQIVEATLADPHHADLLDVAPGDPLMLFERLLRDHAGTPLEYAFARVRADRIALRTQLPRHRIRRERLVESED